MNQLFQKSLSALIKLASLIITAPVTVVLAGQVYADIGSRPLIVLMQIAALVLVDGLLLLNWIQLDRNKQSAIETKLRSTGIVWALYAGLFVLAIQHGEGGAGLVFRLTLGLAILGSTWDSLAYTWRRIREAAKKGAQSDFWVQMHARKLARREAMLARDYTSAVTIAQLQADRDVQLRSIEADKRRRLEALPSTPVEVIITHPEVPELAAPDPAPKPAKKRRSSGQVQRAITKLLAEEPDISQLAAAKRLKMSRTTTRKYWPVAELAAGHNGNGHHPTD